MLLDLAVQFFQVRPKNKPTLAALLLFIGEVRVSGD